METLLQTQETAQEMVIIEKPISPPAKPKKPREKRSGKKIGLHQFSKKQFNEVPGLSERFTRSFGDIEDAFDCLIYGNSGNGKTNFIVSVLKELIKVMACKCVYVSYEEGHTKTLRKTMIERHDMHNAVGNSLEIWDHLTYDELVKEMNKRRSAKIWVIDSVQASQFTAQQCAELKKRFVMSRKKKIIFYISWAKGKQPKGATAESVLYYAHIKIHIEWFVAYFISRFGGNRNWIIYEDGAKKHRTPGQMKKVRLM